MILTAQAAGRVLMKYFDKSSFQVREKKDAGLVTNADLESEQLCVRKLRKIRPDFAFLTEEATIESKPLTLGEQPPKGRWIIDPLDGTTNFVHGFPMFCVSLAAEWENEIVAGVIYHPVLKDTYSAIRGKGAFLNGRRLKVSKTPRLGESVLSTGFTYRKEEALKIEMQAFERLSGIARAIRRPGSAALDLAYTARGVFDGFWERNLSPWDVAAGALIVQEAGGRVTNFKDRLFKVDDREILASNKILHSELRSTISPEYCDLPEST